ncbi:MAG TPA: efflux RND transporter periplasmic adaptor subunit [Vineibacter sp.]|nr:efflux RND transporter periplasmic adaptor subunit [Vineibacter sp.]
MPPDSKDASRPPARGRGLIVGLAVLVIAGLVVGNGVANRFANDDRLRQWTEAQAVPSVAVVQPGRRTNAASLDLPGRLDAYSRAALYARVAGYLKTWSVDIGAPVKAGQVLAEIEAPDLDQQLLQARATLASAEAAEALADVTAKRWQALTGSNAVSQQSIEEKVADHRVKQAQTKAARANVDRLQTLAGFKQILAPFDGIVTARNTDLGALINADSGAGMPLFVVADVRKLRVYVNVPQSFVPGVKPGTKAQITVPEYPARVFAATVEASAQAVDPASGTTRMQLVVENASGELMPGAFASVRLELPQPADVLSVPASALIFGQDGLRIATVDAQNRVVLKTVVVARDLGRVVEIGSGLAPSDRIIETPPDGIADGTVVRIVGDGPAPAGKGKS